VEAPRRPWGNIRYKPEDIPVIGLPTLILAREDFQDMEAFGARREAGLKSFSNYRTGYLMRAPFSGYLPG
jgi:hypothetical protein